jgi:hypothetical protein
MAVAVSLAAITNAVQYFTNQGVVLSGGTITTYIAGTTTPQATYTDATGVTQNSNPITLGSNGYPPNQIWIPNGVLVKFVLKDASSNTIWTEDNVPGVNDPLSYGVSAAMAPVIAASTVDTARALLQIPGQNLLVGDMQVWQRGTSFTNMTQTNYYACDRWGFYRPGNLTGLNVTQVNPYPGVNAPRYGVYMQRAAGDVSTAPLYCEIALETQDSQWAHGTKLTFSITVQANTNYSGGQYTIQIIGGQGTDQRLYNFLNYGVLAGQSFTISTTPTTYSLTATSTSASQQFGIHMYYTPLGTAGANDGVILTNPKLELGASATQLIYRPFAIELALCQRYYEKSFPYQNLPGQNVGYNNGAVVFPQTVGASTTQTINSVNYKVTKRTGATPVLYNPNAANAQIRNQSTGTDWSACSITASSDTGFVAQGTTPGGSAAGQTSVVHWTVDAEI